MSIKAKPAMWCDYCQAPVAGQKATHRSRSGFGFIAAPLTGGASALLIKSEDWHCPKCGQPVRPMNRSDREQLADPEAEARRRTAHDAPPSYAFCTLCWHRIYPGDTSCSGGHALPQG